jgi:hypothetical protein
VLRKVYTPSGKRYTPLVRTAPRTAPPSWGRLRPPPKGPFRGRVNARGPVPGHMLLGGVRGPI